VHVKVDKVMTAEEVADVRKSHRALLEEKLAAVPSFEPAPPTPSEQWSAMVWPASDEAKKDPDTGVSEAVLRDVGKASVTISPEGFVRFRHPFRLNVLMRL
jgi:probable 2-oxoglutarate dehydrogenase E1 component DHKTD1